MNQLPSSIGRYEVERLLGEGGMGVLYLARDPVLDRHVALKLLRVNGEDLRGRFMHEAQSAARLQHPNIVTVYDVGDHGGELYIAMEYIDGDTLATLIRDDVPFSAIRKLDIIDEVADGLGFAHQRGIIHRDIKPANLMMSRGGLVKVLDFGIARVAHRESAQSDAHSLVGTPAYMAPEQLDGAEVDTRSDIYAVGLVMYELFSGRRAFAGATTTEVLQQVMAAQPTPIERLVPDIDPELSKVIGTAMARQPQDRYPDLQAMRKDLARARRQVVRASSDDVTIVVTLPTTGQTKPPGPSPGAGSGPVPIAVGSPPTPAPAPTTPPGMPPLTPTAGSLPPAPTQRPPSIGPTPTWSGASINAPVAATDPATTPVPGRVTGPVSQPVTPVVPPPLPGAWSAPASPVSGVPPTDEGLVPIRLPDVASSGVDLSLGSRTTVDAPVTADVRGPVVRAPAADSGSDADARAASPPRMAVAAAPPPVAPPGVVQSSPVPGAPAVRRGIPAAVIVGSLVAMLAICFIAAFLAVRYFGLLTRSPLTGLFTRTVEPKVTNPPPDAPAPAATTKTEPTPVTNTAATTSGPTEVPAAPPVTPPPVVTTEPPPAPVQENPPVVERPVPRPAPAPPSARVPPSARPSPPARQLPNARQTETIVPTRPVPPERRDVEPPPVVAEAPPRPVERTEPDPPVVAAPSDEGVALVRAYVAARNTAHVSGIRRVWPSVDENHLRRVTSSFSSPLTLVGCEVEARDATHATAACRLTQAGTTNTYAAAQGLTIRRSFVFDLVRQGRTWVIAGLRE